MKKVTLVLTMVLTVGMLGITVFAYGQHYNVRSYFRNYQMNYNNGYSNYGGMMSGYNNDNNESNTYGYGMMGSNGYGMMGDNQGSGINQYTSNILNEDETNKDIEASLKNATIDKEKNAITYSGDSINIVVLGGPEQADGKFVIGGLVNPTVYIPKNSNVTMKFINEDAGMYHNVVIINSAPPYGYMSMMQGQIYPGSYTQMLPPAASGKFYFDSTTFNANYSGEFYYICQYPGHAAKGMYGKIIVQ